MTSYYQPFIEALDQVVIVSDIVAYHVYLTPSLPDFSTLPPFSMVELISLYVDSDCSSVDQTRVVDKVTHSVEVTIRNNPNMLGVRCGWVEEPLSTPGSYTKAKGYVVFLSWHSIPQRSAAADKEPLESIESAIRDTEPLIHVDLVQIRGTSVQRGGTF